MLLMEMEGGNWPWDMGNCALDKSYLLCIYRSSFHVPNARSHGGDARYN